MGKKKKIYSPWLETWLKYVDGTKLIRSEPGNIMIGAKPRKKGEGKDEAKSTY